MRILILNSARRWIGEAAHALALVEQMRLRGHQVVLGVRVGSELEEKAQYLGEDCLTLNFNSRFNPFLDMRDIRRIRSILIERNMDLIHCHRGKDHWIGAAAAHMAGKKIPLLRTRHVVTPASHHLANRWLYRRATDGLIFVSQAARGSLGTLIEGVDSNRNRTILSAVDSERFHPAHRSLPWRRKLNIPDDAVLIGLIARIQRIKGQRYFIEAAAKVAKVCPDSHFLLAGRGTPQQAAELERYVEQVGIPPGRVHFAGILPNLPQAMASLEIGTIASIGSEGSSRVTLEYMASGLPIVATRVGGIPEVLRDGNEGYLVAPRQPGEMADRLIELANNRQLREQMGHAGRLTVEKSFQLDRWANDMEAIYASLPNRSDLPQKPAQ